MYFAHPINVYGTPLEADLVAALAARFPEWEIVNPGSPEIQGAFQVHWDAHRDRTEMNYFYDVLLPTCQGGVLLAFRDLRIGAGAFGETVWLRQRRFPTWEIFPDRAIIALSDLDGRRRLSIDETRARIAGPY